MTRPLHLLALSAACLALPLPIAAQDSPPPDDRQEQAAPPEQSDDMDVVVTGSMAVRQGGAQDIRHFRSVAADVAMPRPESLTVEGLMGEHDLTLPGRHRLRVLEALAKDFSLTRYAARIGLIANVVARVGPIDVPSTDASSRSR